MRNDSISVINEYPAIDGIRKVRKGDVFVPEISDSAGARRICFVMNGHNDFVSVPYGTMIRHSQDTYELVPSKKENGLGDDVLLAEDGVTLCLRDRVGSPFTVVRERSLWSRVKYAFS